MNTIVVDGTSSVSVLAESQNKIVVVADRPSSIVALASTSTTVILADNPTPITVLAESATPVTPFVDRPNSITVLTGVQGQQGIQGPIGKAGGSEITYIAPIYLGGNRVVTSEIIYADSSDILTVGKVIGITKTSAISFAPITIQVIGELNGFFGLIPNLPVYLSTLGNITQTLPLSGYIQKIGIATSSTTILINISEPIVL